MCQMMSWISHIRLCSISLLLPLTHGAQGLKGLNHVRCGTSSLFRLSDDILPRRGWPTIISSLLSVSLSYRYIFICVISSYDIFDDIIMNGFEMSYLVRANLTRVTSPPNSTATRFSSYLLLTLLLYLFFIFYYPRCTLPDFSSVSSLASFPFLSCCHRTTTTTKLNCKTIPF